MFCIFEVRIDYVFKDKSLITKCLKEIIKRKSKLKMNHISQLYMIGKDSLIVTYHRVYE